MWADAFAVLAQGCDPAREPAPQITVFDEDGAVTAWRAQFPLPVASPNEGPWPYLVGAVGENDYLAIHWSGYTSPATLVRLSLRTL